MLKDSTSWLEVSSWGGDGRGRFQSAVFHLVDHVVPREQNNFKPHLLRDRSLALLAVLICTVKIVAISATILGPVEAVSSAAITVPNIVNLTNSARKQAGVKELKNNSVLNQVAQSKAEDMLQNSYFAHTSPSGVSPWDWFNKMGYKYKSAGENLAVNFTDDQAVMDAWLQSPGHRANLLNSGFTEIGIGIATGPYEGHLATFVVQAFGLPLSANTPSPTVQRRTIPSPTSTPKPIVKQATTPTTASNNDNKSSPISLPVPESQLQEISLLDSRATLVNDTLEIRVQFNDKMSTVSATLSGLSLVLSESADNLWLGEYKLTERVSGNVAIKAVAENGKEFSGVISNIENTTESAFGLPANLNAQQLESGPVWERLQNSERVVYPLLITSILTVMVISFLVRHHVHHVKMIANASFVAILASLLWMI